MVSQQLERCDARAGVELCIPQRGERREWREICGLASVDAKHLKVAEHLDPVERAEADQEVEIEPTQRASDGPEVAERS